MSKIKKYRIIIDLITEEKIDKKVLEGSRLLKEQFKGAITKMKIMERIEKVELKPEDKFLLYLLLLTLGFLYHELVGYFILAMGGLILIFRALNK